MAFIWYTPNGGLLDFGLFTSSPIKDEYCRHVLFSAYQITAWWLIFALSIGWLFLDGLLILLNIEYIQASAIAGAFLVFGTTVWSCVILYQLRDGFEEGDENE